MIVDEAFPNLVVLDTTGNGERYAVLMQTGESAYAITSRPMGVEVATTEHIVLMSSGPNAQAHARDYFDRMQAGKIPL